MEGASNGSASLHPKGAVPDNIQFVLDWNPSQMTAGREADPAISPIGYSHPAALYSKHLPPHLTLKRVVLLDTLVSTLTTTVDQAIQDASNKRCLPEDGEPLLPATYIAHNTEWADWAPHHEIGVAELYLIHTAQYCCPIASSLAIHPSSPSWGTVLTWSMDPTEARRDIAGVLRISKDVNKDGHLTRGLLENEDVEKRSFIEQLAFRKTALAIWEMKSLTVGTEEVMQNIAEMGVTRADFNWKGCTAPDCAHHSWKVTKGSNAGYDSGPDPRSPPWTLPVSTRIIPSTSAPTNPRSFPLHENLNASAEGGTGSRLSYKEPSSSSVEDGEGIMSKRHRSDSDASEYKGPPKRSKADPMNESHEPPLDAGQEDNAQLFLQQTWAEAVRNKCTIMILHSGNHEIIGIRHRETQTLYISHVIEPHSCSNPAYGKLQIGIYIAAVQETIDRARQDREKKAGDPSADISPRNEDSNPDKDLDDYSPEMPTRSDERSSGSGSKAKRQGQHEGNVKPHASGEEVDKQALLADAAEQNHLFLSFCYGIYDSPYPASFRRIPDEPPKTALLHPAEPLTPSLSSGHESPSGHSIYITIHSELPRGSTGIVHIGKMAVGPSGTIAEVAIKLAFSRDEKSLLMREHRVYSHLHSRGVQGIPHDIGLFVDEEREFGAEGPYALVMSYAGVSLFGRSERASDSVKDSLLATLRSIHEADVLHGDIRLPNLCVTPSGEAFVVDFSHATENHSRKKKAREIKDLAYYLEMDLSKERCGDS